MKSLRADIRHARVFGSRLSATLTGIVAASLLLAACGSSNTPTSSTSTTIPTATTETTPTVSSAPAATAAVVSANWTKFFDGQTSAAEKIALLQDGSTFTSIVKSQDSSGLAQSARAKVAAVSDVTAATAKVRYAIYLGTTPALPNVSGIAVKQGGTWKVSDASFCQLLDLEGLRTSACATKHEGS